MYYHRHILQGVALVDEFANAFVFTVKTDNTGSSTSTQFTIPTDSLTYTYDYDVEYDGNILRGQTGDVTLEFGVTGTYTVKIKGTFPTIYFNNTGDRQKLLTVIQFGDIAWSSFFRSFFGCSNLTTISNATSELFNTSSVTTLASFCRNCTSLTSINLTNLDTSSVLNMSFVFANCSSLTSLNVTGFNTSLVTNMTQFFANCSLLTSLDVTGFNTSSATNFSLMFFGCSGITSLDVTGFNTSSVSNMSSMFQNCTALSGLVINGFNITSLTNGDNMFNGANSALSTSEYDLILVNWEAQTEQSSVTIHFGDATYTLGSASATARGVLTGTSLWSITDGGGI